MSGVSIKNETVMYVTRGIGTSKTGYDYRLFSSPEIVLINPPGDNSKSMILQNLGFPFEDFSWKPWKRSQFRIVFDLLQGKN